MTARSKGAGYERRARDLLLKWGYKLHQARPSLFWKNGHPISFSYDLHKAFDFNALHQTRPDRHVQVTDIRNAAHRRRKVEKVMAGLASNPHHDIDLWSFGKDKKHGYHLRIERMVSDTEWELLSIRKYDGTAIFLSLKGPETGASDPAFVGYERTE